jgi:hypothetical protein
MLIKVKCVALIFKHSDNIDGKILEQLQYVGSWNIYIIMG